MHTLKQATHSSAHPNFCIHEASSELGYAKSKSFLEPGTYDKSNGLHYVASSSSVA